MSGTRESAHLIKASRRWFALAAAAIAAAGCAEPDCGYLLPESQGLPFRLVARNGLVTAGWVIQDATEEDLPSLRPSYRVASRDVDGPLGAYVDLGAHVYGSIVNGNTVTAGTRSTLWTGGRGERATRVTTVSGIVVTTVELAENVDANRLQSRASVVFDGAAYHLFWIQTGEPYGQLHHRQVDEDGALGPDQLLPMAEPPEINAVGSIVAATDGVGGWLAVLAAVNGRTWGTRLDLVTGTAERVWNPPELYLNVTEVVWFDGAYRIPNYSGTSSLTPTGTVEEQWGNYDVHDLVVGRDALFALAIGPQSRPEIHRLNAGSMSWDSSGIQPIDTLPTYAIDGDVIVVFERSLPSELSLVGYAPTGEEVWRTTVEPDGPTLRYAFECYED